MPGEQLRDVFLREDSLGAIDVQGQFSSDYVMGYVGEPMYVRVCGHATDLHRHHTNVQVYLGDPDDGNVVALKTLQGINGMLGSCSWFSWVPQEPGDTQLTAFLHEQTLDGIPGNNTVSLDVAIEYNPASGQPSLPEAEFTECSNDYIHAGLNAPLPYREHCR